MESIKLWGTRGSTPISGPEYQHFGGNTSCMEIRLESAALLFDAGTGIRQAGIKLLADNVLDIALIISHFHWDHILGFPFFKPFYNSSCTVTIYAPGDSSESIKHKLSTLMSSPFFPIELKDLRAQLRFQPLLPTQKIRGITIACCTSNHPGGGTCFNIRTQNKHFGYCTDNEFLQGVIDKKQVDEQLINYQEQIALFSELPLVIHEAQYMPEEYPFKIGWGHTCVSNGIELIKAAKIKEWLITHHDPESTDEGLKHRCEYIQQRLDSENIDCNVRMAYDGMLL